jgi:hypothetical protein
VGGSGNLHFRSHIRGTVDPVVALTVKRIGALCSRSLLLLTLEKENYMFSFLALLFFALSAIPADPF